MAPPIVAAFVSGVTDPVAVVAAMAAVVGSPLIWNIIARSEYRTHWLTRLAGGKYRGCYALAVWIFTSSLYRDWLFAQACLENPSSLIFPAGHTALDYNLNVGRVLCAVGSILVLASYYRLGITGTYLGDYFGIYMKERVTAFPYTLFDDPMYTGATLAFLGQAVEWNSAVGVFLAVWVWLVYKIATKVFEDPFTTEIYRVKAEREAAEAKKAQ